ncbi:UNVERIFIED_CONTAM: hypothetical protein Sradi_0302500 [Sesamum radiatum]|uniref:Secreted protein n=1 Tax=Sesamum radiatum TaxID=300843 RepID=A0AAW2W549_SESRA
MSKKSSVVARRAWNILRLALLWARKGGLFRNRLMLNFNVYVRKLLHSNVDARGALAYGDRSSPSTTPPSFMSRCIVVIPPL